MYHQWAAIIYILKKYLYDYGAPHHITNNDMRTYDINDVNEPVQKGLGSMPAAKRAMLVYK